VGVGEPPAAARTTISNGIGESIMKASDKPVVVEQSYNASIDDVWRAITEVDQMRRWFFENIASFKPEVGFATQFDVQSEGRNFLHMWKVTKVVPSSVIEYNWKYGGFPGDSFVVWELFEDNNKTTLRLSCHVTEDFPDEIPEFRRESCVQGWTFFLGTNLKEYLETSR
jgi:uncharacterized protein YndB with AHSA1/START domain